MADQSFAQWAEVNGLAPATIEQIMTYASTPEQRQEAFDAMMPGPPIYTLNGIRKLFETDGMGLSPQEHGFMIIGGCPNGDPIAIDIEVQKGTVWYLAHETIRDRPLRASAIKVADTVEELMNGIFDQEDFPIDYYSARSRLE